MRRLLGLIFALVIASCGAGQNEQAVVSFPSTDGRFSFTVDCTEAPDLVDWATNRLQRVVEVWYGRLADDFASPGFKPRPSISYRLRKDMKVPGLKHGTTVDLNIGWIRKHPDNVKLGMVIHETWHTLQLYKSKCPTWLSEGITDWVRYYHYEKSPVKVNWRKAKVDAGYGKTAAFLEWCRKKHGSDFVHTLIADLRSGAYDGGWWLRKTGRTLEELSARLTGRPVARTTDADTSYGIGNTRGSCLVGPCMPYGSAHPSPDSVFAAKDRNRTTASGYFPGDPVDGFSQIHAHGAGRSHPSYGLFLVRPCAADGTYVPSRLTLEETSPHRFRGRLESGVAVTIVPTHHGAFYRFAYPKGARGKLSYDVRRKIGQDVASKDAVLHREGARVWGGGTYSGNWNPGNYRCHFYAEEETDGDAVLLRIAVSFNGVETARKWFAGELKGRDEATLAAAAEAAWREKLSAIEVEGLDASARRRFYSNLYHCFIQPRNRSGDFAWSAAGEPVLDDQYTVWDTWRTLFPLLAIVDPKAAADNVNSYVVRQRKLGRCEIAFIAGLDFQAGQGGDDVDIVIADAVAKDLPGVDRDGAWRVVSAHAARRTEEYRRLGWAVSNRREGYDARFRSGSSTLAFAYDDWCAAQVAQATHHVRAAQELARRSGNWTNVWDVSATDGDFTGFVRARNADGTFSRTSPKKGTDFYQGSSWEYSFFVPHDVESLISRCGGQEKFLARLDAAFEGGRIHFSNEPSFLTPFLANWCARPDRTVSYVKRMLESFDDDGPPGDDDSGAMGSLYVFLKAGFFPVAGQDLYVLHGTDVPCVRFKLGGDRSFAVRGTVGGKWTTVTLNGRPLATPFIRHADILAGGELVFK